MTVLLAAAIGLIMAGMAAYLLDYLDDTIKTPDDVKKILDLTTLGAVPRVQDGDTELVALSTSQSPAVESYRILRTNLQFAAVNHPLDTMLITSPSPTEGKSLTVANLAVAMAQAGKKTVIIDADLHRPRQHRLFSLPNNVGVTTALLAEHPDPGDLLQSTEVDNLQVLTSGPLPPNPAELLGSDRMKELLQHLVEQTDVIIMDSPPAIVLSDAMILATQSDGVLLVLDVGQTRRDAARRAVESLRQVNARIVGVLLNRVPTNGGGYYYYYYYSGYYSDDDQNGRGKGLRSWGRRKKRRKRTQPQVSPTPAPSPPAPQPAQTTVELH
jgi:capsular exopolysaccharide synthesis family protein